MRIRGQATKLPHSQTIYIILKAGTNIYLIWQKTVGLHKTLSSALSLAKVGNMFPNITTIFELLLTLPVVSCSCERSFSAMRRLKTWQRSIMGESRFNGLALMNIHSNNDVGQIDLINVLKRFDQTGHLRIGRVFCEESS